MKKQQTTTLTLRLSPDIKDRLERLAQSTARSKSWLAFDALVQYLKIQEWQISEIEAGLKEAGTGDFASDDDIETIKKKWLNEG